METIQRRQTVAVRVGPVMVGYGHPVVVQSMTNTDTADAAATAGQVAALALSGSELVRITVNNDRAARAVPEIAVRLRDLGIDVPLVGDFHYNGHLLLSRYPDCARTLAKYRINPGNVGAGRHRDENFRRMIEVANENAKPVRIGVNWGSLDQALLVRLMDENAAFLPAEGLRGGNQGCHREERAGIGPFGRRVRDGSRPHHLERQGLGSAGPGHGVSFPGRPL